MEFAENSVSLAEMVKGNNTFTPAAFLGSKNLHQKCMIRAKFNTKIVKKQCETPGYRIPGR